MTIEGNLDKNFTKSRNQHWFGLWFVHGLVPEEASSHHLNQCWPELMSAYVVARPQWVNSLQPNDAIWRRRSGSTLSQVMACCLTAPSHYLNKCWLSINNVPRYPYKSIFTGNVQEFNMNNKITFPKFLPSFPRGQWVNSKCTVSFCETSLAN